MGTDTTADTTRERPATRPAKVRATFVGGGLGVALAAGLVDLWNGWVGPHALLHLDATAAATVAAAVAAGLAGLAGPLKAAFDRWAAKPDKREADLLEVMRAVRAIDRRLQAFEAERTPS